ncbi:MAG: hypothetical protein ABIQ18_02345 [Umezawaea sp.]
MAPIPAFLLRHEVTVEPYLGEGGAGPVFGPPVTARCFREDARKLVRNEVGEQVVSETTCYALPGTVAPPKSRVQVGDREAFVIVSRDRNSGTPEPLDHVEVVLT